MIEVAKEKKAGALNESAESIKVMLLLGFVLYWLMTEVAKKKKTGGPNESEESIKVMVLLFDCLIVHCFDCLMIKLAKKI